MARIKILAFFSLSIVYLAFASAKSNPGLWYEFQPRFQEPPVVPFGPQVPEGRIIGTVINFALRGHYESRLKTMEKTVTDLEDLVSAQKETLNKLNKEFNDIDATLLELQEEKCDPPKNYSKTPTPIIIYTNGPPKGYYGGYGQPEVETIYPVKGQYGETDHYSHKKDYYEETDDYDKPKGHYENTDDYDKPKGHYENTDDFDKPKGHYEKTDDYDKPKGHYENTDDYDKPKGHYKETDNYDKPNGHYGKSETQTSSSSPKMDKKPIVSPKQKSSEGKSFINGYDDYAQQEGDFYTQYYPSRYRSGKELKSELKNVKESLKDSSEKSSKNQKKSIEIGI